MKTNENKLAAIVLAAGTSVRMGGNKLLKQWRGKPLLSHCFAAVMDGKNAGLFSFVAAVCGCDAAQTSKLLAAADKIVYNRNYQSGMSSSLICGLDALPQSCAGALIFLGDMPIVSRADIAAVAGVWHKCRGECDMVVAAHNGKCGNPVLLSARMFWRVRKLTLDTGARALFADSDVRLAKAGRGVLLDMDTPEDMAAA